MAKKITKKEKKLIGYGIIVLLVFLCILSIFKVGILGAVINNFVAFIFGDFFLVYLIIVGLFLVKKYVLHNRRKVRFTVVLSIILFCIALLLANALYYYKGYSDVVDYKSFGALSSVFGNLKGIFKKETIYYGGLISVLLFSCFFSIINYIGTLVICILLFLLSLFVLVPFDVYRSIGLFISNFLHQARLGIKDIILKSYKSGAKPIAQPTIEDNSYEEYEEEPSYTDDSNPIEEDTEVSEEESFNEEEPVVEEESDEEKGEEENPSIIEPKKVTVNSFAGYKLPSLKLLEDAVALKSGKNQSNAEFKGKKLIEVLRTFGIKSTLIDIHIGPSVTKFEIKPEASVNLNKINSLQDNIKMELAAKEIRIEAPIPGRNAVGIEIPNVENEVVKLSELLANMPAKIKNNPLVFALGKDLMGQAAFCEINKMPHLLIGGATGSGKSVCINALISSILMRSHPSDVKLVLIDPKKVEFTPYHDIPHLLWPVITDAKMASNLLVKVVTIMKERYDLFSATGVRDIASYNAKVKEHNASSKDKMEKLPYIVVVIDELADLMLVAGKEVETSIQRITQLSRASGIHLVVATQRPSTDVITGLIKSNINSRIAFMTATAIDSRTILDQAGADRLLGNGDMLYKPQGENSPTRIQGCYVSDAEIQAITNEVKKFKPQYDDTYYQLERIKDDYNSSNDTDGGDDSLYEDAVEFIRKTRKASTSLLQRKFGIGYNRAARMIDTLESRGIIGPANGSKPREVYINKEEDEEN